MYDGPSYLEFATRDYRPGRGSPRTPALRPADRRHRLATRLRRVADRLDG